MCSLLEDSNVYRIVDNQPVRFISQGIRGVKQVFKLKNAEMHGWRGIQRLQFWRKLDKSIPAYEADPLL